MAARLARSRALNAVPATPILIDGTSMMELRQTRSGFPTREAANRMPAFDQLSDKTAFDVAGPISDEHIGRLCHVIREESEKVQAVAPWACVAGGGPTWLLCSTGQIGTVA
jgi:hypothetical protein